MKTRLFHAWMLGLSIATIACGDDTNTGGGGSSNGGNGGATAGGGTGGTGGTETGGGGQGGAIEGLSATWTEQEVGAPTATEWPVLGPLTDLEICLLDGSKCSTTDESGIATIMGLNENENFAVVMQKAGISPTLLQYATETSDLMFGGYMGDDTVLAAFFGSAGCTFPPASGKANLIIGVPPGASVESMPDLAWVYSGADGFDPLLTAVPADTPTSLAWAAVCDVDADTIQLTFLGTVGTCYRYEGWPPSGDNDVDGLTAADMTTIVNWICD